MIHGWAQNAVVMSWKTKSLTKKLNQAGYDCIFPQALFQLPMTSLVEVGGEMVQVTNGSREHAKAWFLYSNEDPSDTSLSQTGQVIDYVGMDDSLRVIKEELKTLPKENSSVSILGFSQGAVFCHVLASLAAKKIPPFDRIGKCILVSGFCATPQGYSKESLSQIRIPSLHVIGSDDTSVVPSLSVDLAARFVNPDILRHEKGHILPQQSARCTKMIEFLNGK
jgi:pimeloyl-ACP methyl ester carboxylesterase